MQTLAISPNTISRSAGFLEACLIPSTVVARISNEGKGSLKSTLLFRCSVAESLSWLCVCPMSHALGTASAGYSAATSACEKEWQSALALWETLKSSPHAEARTECRD